ncbi:BNR-4 repeat-containing protein [Actinomadura harenae]|uniref:BNR repeat-containing family member n=1 Tax=Actinomadura harenae TaxID=2483351 RepID=A0A3M2M024_9ACTN|nr:BNR-4 repeat-containing protein [Actinomadura harenae]RMI42917.1 hypothetical protein EBO15_17990 [Actinomadura harenae]
MIRPRTAVLRGGAAVVAAAAALAVLPATGASAEPVAPTQVPYAMDSANAAGWWTPLATYKGAGEYTYMAFNEPGATEATHRVAIARRDPSGAWTRLPLMNGSAQAEYADDIGHNAPSMARDGSGRFHVFASMHNVKWQYYRSDTVGGTPTNHSADLPDPNGLFTYPVVATAPNGDLYLAARMDGGTFRSGRLYRWDDAASTWSTVGTFASTDNRSVYPDDLQIDASGNVHLLFEWALAPASAYRHQPSYLKYSPSTGKFSDHTGAAVTTPVGTATADVIQPLSAGEDYRPDATETGPVVQSAKLALDGTTPRVAYRYRTPTSGDLYNVRYAAPSGADWTRSTIYSATQTRAALGITAPATIYYVTESGTDRVFAATPSSPGVSVAPGLPIQRLAVTRDADGEDALYLADPAGLKLYFARR